MRWKRIIGMSVFLIVAVVAAVYVVLATYDYNKLKPRLARMVKEATGRELQLGGEIDLAMGLSPTLVVTDAVLANTSWGSQPQMIKIDKLELQFRLLPLLFKDLNVNRLGLSGARVLLETGPEAQPNWVFPAGKATGGLGALKPAKIEVDQVRIVNSHITFWRHQTKSKTQFSITSLVMNRRGREDGLTLKLRADFNGQAVALDGTIGSIDQLRKRERFPIQLAAKASSITATIDGMVDDIHALTGFDLQLDGSGRDLSEIGPFIGQELPATDQFALKGRLTGSAKALALEGAQGNARRGHLHFTVDGAVQDFLTLGGMDLQSRLTGTDLADFGKVIGVALPATDEFEIQGRLSGSTDGLALQAAQASAGRGTMRLSLKGAVEDLLTLTGMDLQSSLTGKELVEIGPLVGAALPDLGPFDVQGRLTGSPQALSLKPLEAVVDKSDFKGQVSAAFRNRPLFTIRLDSSLIDFTALMQSLEKENHRSAKKEKPKRRLFSDDPLPWDGLQKVDADIVLKAEHIHARDARLEMGHLIIKLEDRDLRIEKFKATYKGTQISGNFHIKHGETPEVATDFLVQNFNLGDFLKETGKSDEVRAVIDIAAHGTSRGRSVSGLMANLDGAIGAVMGKGFLTQYLDMLSVGLSDKVAQIWDPPKDVEQIKCAVVQFDITKGVAASRAFVFDTRAGIIDGEGQIDLGTETIDFLLVPKSRRPELSFRPILKISGTVLDPQVGIDKGALATSAAKALSSLVVGPVGLLAPFAHLGANKAHPCNVPGVGQGAPDMADEERVSKP
jgi:uncharacterized protein involved in outer membrane biogenesis